MGNHRKGTKLGKKQSVSFGWVGRWSDGTLGWFLPHHLAYPPNGPEVPAGETAVLCRITVELVRDSMGREIRKIVK